MSFFFGLVVSALLMVNGVVLTDVVDGFSFLSCRLRSWGRVAELFVKLLLKGEDDCTSENARGQFSIFGAVEENPRRGSSGVSGDAG